MRLVTTLLLVAFCCVARGESLHFSADGIVTDETGKPIAGATVELTRRASVPHTVRIMKIEVVASTKSDASGAFSLAGDLPDKGRDAWVRATAPDKAAGAISISISRNPFEYFDYVRQVQITKPWLILFPQKKVHGIVVNEQDQPVPNCRVQTSGLQDETVTGADGAFDVALADVGDTGFSGTGRIVFEHPDYVSCEVRTPFESSSIAQPDGSIKVTLEAGVLISGTITAEGNRALPGASISITGSGRTVRDLRERLYASVNADEQGKFSLRVPPNEEIRFSPRATEEADGKKSYYGSAGQPRSETFTQDTADVNFELQKLQHATGVVKFPAGADPKQFIVTASSNNVPAEAETCQSDGSFDLSQLPPGTYDLAVQGLRDSNTLTTGSTEIVAGQDVTGIELTVADVGAPATTLHGKVLNADGTPAVLATVRLLSHSQRYFRPVHTDLDGSFLLASFPSGEACELWVSSSTRESAGLLKLDADADPATPVEIKLAPSATITGKVVDGDDKPIAGLTIMLADLVHIGTSTSHRTLLSTRTDAEGKYTIKGVLVPEDSELMVEPSPAASDGVVRIRSLVGHPVTELKSGESLDGLNFRIRDSGGTTEITAEKE